MKASFWKNVVVFWQILTDKKTPMTLKLLFIGAMIYGISPIDFIPEFAPIIGVLDDILLLYFVVTHIWKKTQKIRNELWKKDAIDVTPNQD